MSADDRVTLSTPERVAVDLAVAGIGHRALAWSVDAMLQLVVWATLLFVAPYLLDRPLWEEFQALKTTLQVLVTVGIFAVNWGYHVAFEIAWSGRSPGKRLLGIRVVRPDGSPEGPLEAVIRNVMRSIDVLPLAYATGIVAIAVTRNHQRLGDLLAGTLLVKDRRYDLSRYEVAAGGAVASGPGLTAAQYELVTSFLARREGLEPEARARVALQIATAVAGALPEAERRVRLADARSAETWLAQAAAAYGGRR